MNKKTALHILDSMMLAGVLTFIGRAVYFAFSNPELTQTQVFLMAIGLY